MSKRSGTGLAIILKALCFILYSLVRKKNCRGHLPSTIISKISKTPGIPKEEGQVFFAEENLQTAYILELCKYHAMGITGMFNTPIFSQ